MFYGFGVEVVVFVDGKIWIQQDFWDMFLIGMFVNEDFVGFLNSDIYVYVCGGGYDIIIESVNYGNDDMLFFVDIDLVDVMLLCDGSDFIFFIVESSLGFGDDGLVWFVSFLNDFYGFGVEKVVFVDGIVWMCCDMQVMLLDVVSIFGDDIIVGMGDVDLFSGGFGNDQIFGGGGSDMYVYWCGDGYDSFFESFNGGSVDIFFFVDIVFSEVNLIWSGYDVILLFVESSGGVGDVGFVFLEYFLDGVYGRGVEIVIFFDGVVWIQVDFCQMLLEEVVIDGDDIIIGFDELDIFVGGLGNDMFQGGKWSDIYVYMCGDGNDIIIEVWVGNGMDIVYFINIFLGEVSLECDGNIVWLVIVENVFGSGDGGIIIMVDSFDENFDLGIEQVVFVDEIVWSWVGIWIMLIEVVQIVGDDMVIGFNIGDMIDGGLGNDLLQGVKGDDIYIYVCGDGYDCIVDGLFFGYNDMLIFIDINVVDVSVYWDGDYLLLVIVESSVGVGDGGSILFEGIVWNWFGSGVDKVVFVDGFEWIWSDMMVIVVVNVVLIFGNDIFFFFVLGVLIEISYFDFLVNDFDLDGNLLMIVGFQNVVGGQVIVNLNDMILVLFDDLDVVVIFEYVVIDGVYWLVVFVLVGYVQLDVIDELDFVMIDGMLGNDVYWLVGGMYIINFG